jgi:hypothetical protein
MKFLGVDSRNPPRDINHYGIRKLKSHLRHVRIQHNYLKDQKTKKPVLRQRSINGVANLTPGKIIFDEDDPTRGTKKSTNVEKFFWESMFTSLITEES